MGKTERSKWAGAHESVWGNERVLNGRYRPDENSNSKFLDGKPFSYTLRER